MELRKLRKVRKGSSNLAFRTSRTSRISRMDVRPSIVAFMERVHLVSAVNVLILHRRCFRQRVETWTNSNVGHRAYLLLEHRWPSISAKTAPPTREGECSRLRSLDRPHERPKRNCAVESKCTSLTIDIVLANRSVNT
jgi:hypothetical protein